MNFSSFFRLAACSAALIGLFSPLQAQQTSQDKSKPKSSSDTVRLYVVPSVTVTTTRAKESVSPIPFSEISHAEL